MKNLVFSDSQAILDVSRQRAHHPLPTAVDIGSRAKFLVALTALRHPNRSVSKYEDKPTIAYVSGKGHRLLTQSDLED